MKIKTNIKAGGGIIIAAPARNHNETMVRSLKVRTGVKAGSLTNNHNEMVVRPALAHRMGEGARRAGEGARSLKVKTHLKAGGGIIQTAPAKNHNQMLLGGQSN